jgi:signal transduction histidine kinase
VVLWRWALVGADVAVGASVMAAEVLMRPVSGWWVWCVAALLGLPLTVRRCWPVPVLAVVLAAGSTTVIVGVGAEVSVYAVALALYPVALSSARAGYWALGAALTGVLVPGLVDAVVAGLPLVPARDDAESFTTAPMPVAAYSTAVIAGSWALAWAVRSHRGHAVRLAELQTAHAVTEERLRIARDVHDVVGHNLSLIAMKAAVASHLETDRQAALHTIEHVSRAALNEVRAVLGGLRGTTHPADTDLERLVEQTRASGVTVTIDRGDMSSLPACLRVSVHWIVQEALTNVRRHAHATRCQVTIKMTREAVNLTVLDDGVAQTPAGFPGHGLLGMRERAALHGGSLSAGPEPLGGFAVRATLPFPA